MLGFTVKNPFRNGSEGYVCSELVAELLTQFTDYNFNDHLDEVTPKMIYDTLSKMKQDVV